MDEDMKAEFEAWIRGDSLSPDHDHKYDATEEGGARLLWDLWQAAWKKSLQVEREACAMVREARAADAASMIREYDAAASLGVTRAQLD